MKSKQLIANLRGKVYVSLSSPAEFTETRKERLITLTKELGELGYSLTPEALLYLSDLDMTNIMKEVIPHLHEMFHPGEVWKPLYPGFPDQVISKTEKELWEDQHQLYDTMDYDEFLKNNPWYTEEELEEIEDSRREFHHPEKVLGVMNEQDLLNVFKSILASGNSLHAETREELKWFLENYPDFELPEKIPFKETMCVVMSYRDDYKANDINDILRYGIYSMGGNPELVNVPKKIKSISWRRTADTDNKEWRNLKASRKTRVAILSRIDEVVSNRKLNVCIPDAKKFYGHWLLLSERVHPGEYSHKFPNASQFFRVLKSKSLSKKYKTWNSMLQEKYNSGEDIVEIAKYISNRPGEFVRRFDSLLRRCMSDGREFEVMDIFLGTSGMKNKTLLELRNYYEKRASRCPRMISKKGTSTMHQLEELEPLPIGIVDTVRETIERKILLNIKDSVKEKDLEDKVVYIDPEISNIPIPVAMRDKLFVVPPCTRFDIPEDKKYIRMFIHWIQKGVPEDLDLHAYLYKDEHCNRNIGWNTGTKFGTIAVHSGDVLNREGECAEYVDIDIDAAKADGWNYVVMDVMNYKGRGFDTLDNWLGYTTLDKIGSPSKTWVPKNIDFSQKISVKDDKIAAWIFDLNRRQAILIGVGLSGIPINYGNQNQAIIKFFAEPQKFTCYDVLMQWYKSRGASIVNDKQEEHDEEVNQSDVILDYTKILEILG